MQTTAHVVFFSFIAVTAATVAGTIVVLYQYIDAIFKSLAM